MNVSLKFKFIQPFVKTVCIFLFSRVRCFCVSYHYILRVMAVHSKTFVFLSGLKVNILKKPSTDQCVFQFIEVPGMSSNSWETCFLKQLQTDSATVSDFLICMKIKFWIWKVSRNFSYLTTQPFKSCTLYPKVKSLFLYQFFETKQSFSRFKFHHFFQIPKCKFWFVYPV